MSIENRIKIRESMEFNKFIERSKMKYPLNKDIFNEIIKALFKGKFKRIIKIREVLKNGRQSTAI